jgi:serine/threonine-protein kinase
MGSVWMAQHEGLGIPVAVKLLREEHANHPGAFARLRREAAATARIRCPHVVQLFDLGITAGGVPYIVMELLEGQTLEDMVAARGRLTLDETLLVVRQVASALDKAHDQGVVHRDIKPDNLFVIDTEKDIFVKVLDFGVALDLYEHADRLTATGTVVGTPHFMSPEQMVGGEDVTHRSDIWSLGVVAYYCMTGVLPYQGDSVAALAIAIDRSAPPPPSAIAPDLPPWVDAWMTKILEPDPTRRIATARAMIEELDLAAASSRVQAPRAEPASAPAPRLPSSGPVSGRRIRLESLADLDAAPESDAMPTAAYASRRSWSPLGVLPVVAAGLVLLVLAWIGLRLQRAEANEGQRPLARTAAPWAPPVQPPADPPPPPGPADQPALVERTPGRPTSSSARPRLGRR